jgi:U3 small nucleolar RNA-associated protein MPP10
MGAEQIWEQLELRTKTICSLLDSIIEREDEETDKAEEGSLSNEMVLEDSQADSDDPDSDDDLLETEESSGDDEGGDGSDLGEHVTALQYESNDEDIEEEEDTNPKSNRLNLDRSNRHVGPSSQRSVPRTRHTLSLTKSLP